jgi:2-deoxy-D-gluconate 3-dehydrogenase
VAGVGSSGDFEDVENGVTAAGRRFTGIQADLRDRASIESMVRAALDACGHIDVLVNNAGITRRGPCLVFTETDWDEVVEVNLRAVFFLSQGVARVMIQQGVGGKIINVASMLSFQGGVLVPSYAAAKSGVLGVTRAMANELAPHGINVNAVAPGYIATRITQPLQDDPERNRQILERIPAGRWGRPEDLGGIVVFLASSASAYCHGAVFPVDGGWLAR